MSKKITVRNTLNGQVAQVRPEVFSNPHLAKHLVQVEDDAKPLNLSKPTTAEEFTARRDLREPEQVPEPRFEFPEFEDSTPNTEKEY